MNRRRRVRVLAVSLAVLAATLGVQAATSDATSGGVVRSTDRAYPGNTLVTVQSYDWFHRNNGRAFVVAPDGEVTWEYDPPRTRVFDGEELANGDVLLTTARFVPNAECPERFRDTDRNPGHCVENAVVEVDRETGDVVWRYAWFDVYLVFHESHDADRTGRDETVVADMGNERVFAVDRSGEVTWEWDAAEHVGPGTAFWETHVPGASAGEFRREGPESDWTHLNDVDVLSNGTVQVSIRNFDVVVRVDRETGDVVGVVGQPGNTSVLHEQHDPHRIGNGGTLLVPDSENDRVVEYDVETGEVVWSYTGGTDRLQWPRDADRLPNGNTLIVDSRNFRVLEVTPDGEVAWAYSVAGERGIVYDADRLSVPEEPSGVPSGRDLSGDGEATANPLVRRLGGAVHTVESWAGFVFPPWVGVAELVVVAAGLAVAVALTVDASVLLWGRYRS